MTFECKVNTVLFFHCMPGMPETIMPCLFETYLQNKGVFGTAWT